MASSRTPAEANSIESAGLYSNWQFWFAYIANFALMTGSAMMYRFAELVAYLGGDERTAGAIVGAGLLCVLFVRLFLGRGIDHYGTRTAWILSALLFITGSLSFLACHQISYGIYVARILFAIGVAGMLTCSIVHVQNIVPVRRRTEAIGTIGTSGFLGMIAGANLADLIFDRYPNGDARFIALCGTVALLGVLYLAIVAFLLGQDHHAAPEESPAISELVVRYWPGLVILVAITFGMGLSVTTVFLTRFVTAMKLPGIHTFFTTYSLVALIFRMPATRWCRSIGRHKTILLGLLGNTVGQAAFPFVTRDWHFLVPATACGFGHALLYPAIVSLGSGAFPRRYRGTGTTIVLGFMEAGTAISPPALGWIIDRSGFNAMFYTAAAIGAAVTIYYAVTAARQPDDDSDEEPEAVIDSEFEPSLTPAADLAPSE
jgi:MFS family permease